MGVCGVAFGAGALSAGRDLCRRWLALVDGLHWLQVRSDMSKQIRDLQDTLLRERQTRLAEHDTFASSLRKQMSTTDSPVSSKLATGMFRLCTPQLCTVRQWPC